MVLDGKQEKVRAIRIDHLSFILHIMTMDIIGS